MSAVEYLVAGLLAGYAVVSGIALVVLFRRVAALERASSTKAEEIEPIDEYEDESAEVDDGIEDDSDHVHFTQRHSLARGPRQEKRRPEAIPSVAKPEQRPLRSSVSFDDAVAAYNALVADFGGAEFQAFERRWHPVSAVRSGENELADDPKGDFWIIRTADSPEPYGLVVPGPEVVREWELYYRSMGSLTAKNLLKGFYDVGDSAPLRLDRPAIAVQEEKGWRVQSPGRFADN